MDQNFIKNGPKMDQKETENGQRKIKNGPNKTKIKSKIMLEMDKNQIKNSTRNDPKIISKKGQKCCPYGL